MKVPNFVDIDLKKIAFLAEIVFLKFQTDPSGNLGFGKRHSSLNIFARLY